MISCVCMASIILYCTACTVCLTLILCIIWPHVARTYLCKRRTASCLLPPGPLRLPLLGNLHQLLLCKPHGLIHQALAKLAKQHGPLMCLHMGSKPALFISSGAIAKAFIQANDRHFASRPAFAFCNHLLYGQHNGVAFSTYGPRWRKMRRICTLELFTTKRIMSFQKVLEEELALLVNDVNLLCECSTDGSVEMNIAHLAHLVVSNMMGRLVLGKRMCDTFVNGECLVDMFKRTNDAIVPAMTDFLPAFLGSLLDVQNRQKMTYTHKHIDAFWTAILEERRQHKHSKLDAHPPSLPRDFLDVLLSSPEVVELGDDNIKATLMDILGAGSETSSIAIEWAMAELLQNRHCFRILQTELDTACPAMHMLQVSSPLMCPVLGSQWAQRHVLMSQLSSMPAAPQTLTSSSSLPSTVSCPSLTYWHVAEASYLKAVVKETLRLHPPVPLLIPRASTAGTRCQFGEYTFEDSLMLFVNAWAVGRDGAVWQEPDAFQPDRFDASSSKVNYGSRSTTRSCNAEDFQMLPFGAGRRRCPGMALALCIMELTVATFIRAFHWELSGQLKVDDMREKSGSAGTHKAEPLVAVLRPRTNAKLAS